jgi:hypothetical protein
MINEEYRGAQQWSRNKQAVFTVIWISLLSAAIAGMVFFALFDPASLAGIIDEDLIVGRGAGYLLGFLFFWILALACATMTAFLVRTAPKRDAKHRE